MPLPNPTTLWKYAKVAIKLTYYAVPVTYAYLDSILTDSAVHDDPHWVRAVMRYSRVAPSGLSEDFAQIKFDLVNITGGAIDTSWTSADLNDVSTHLQAWMTTLLPEMSSNSALKEIRYYDMSYNPVPDLAKPFRDSGPPLRIDTLNMAGTGVGDEPFQVATSITLRTAWPRHWGRIYFPTPWHAGGYVDTNGRLQSAHQTALANATAQLIADLAGHDFLVVVPSTSLGNAPFHVLLNVVDTVVDDVPDVQRRRRARTVGTRVLGTHA